MSTITARRITGDTVGVLKYASEGWVVRVTVDGASSFLMYTGGKWVGPAMSKFSGTLVTTGAVELLDAENALRSASRTQKVAIHMQDYLDGFANEVADREVTHIDRLHHLAGFPGYPCGASVDFTGLDADEQVLVVEYTSSLSDDIIDDVLNS